MSVNLEVKGTVAKLLAQENLIVEHRKVETAQFNVDTRVLTLPIWDKASNVIFDLLVAHEVGHALYTPNEDTPEDIPHQFINVVEDARIEKLIKRRFPGLAKTFFRGYKEFNEMDFFSIADEDISLMSLADRANLYFKIGHHSYIPIKDGEEMSIVKTIADSETFDEVIAASKLLYEYDKNQTEQRTKETSQQNQEGNSQQEGQSSAKNTDDSSSDNDDDSSDTSNASGGSSRSQSNRDSSDDDSGMDSDNSSEPSVNTADSLEDKVRSLANNFVKDSVYIQIPNIPLDKIVINNQLINNQLEEHWNVIYVEDEMKRQYLYPLQKSYRQYKRDVQKEVNYMVKEFECRKSATSYSRASVSRTGVLDCTKLHTYKYNEDLFKKITTLPDGKNHGLVFVLDWSGSMANLLEDTVKQLFNLVWFCRKVNIPFKVYGFTNSWWSEQNDHRNRSLLEDPKKNEFFIEDTFRMLEFLTSDCNSKEFERQCMNFWTLAVGNRSVHYPPQYQLGGTPLNEAAMCLHYIIPQFKNEKKLEKVHSIILTDGESCFPMVGYERHTYDGSLKVVGSCIRSNDYVYLRDPKLRTTYKMDDFRNVESILKNLGDRYPEVNTIGIRIASGGDFQRFLRWYYPFDTNTREKYSQQFKKNKAASVEVPSFAKFFVMNSNSLQDDATFEVEEGANKATIRAAFKKSLTKTKFNRRILSEFVELVA